MNRSSCGLGVFSSKSLTAKPVFLFSQFLQFQVYFLGTESIVKVADIDLSKF